MSASVPVHQQHRRNASSKSGMLMSLASSNPRPPPPEPTMPLVQPSALAQSAPQFANGHRHAASSAGVLGERQSNLRSPPPSPPTTKTQPSPTKSSRGGQSSHSYQTKSNSGLTSKRSKSSSNLHSVFAKMNRSHKDVSLVVKAKDKENTTPPSTADITMEPPIWAQFAVSNNLLSQHEHVGTHNTFEIEDEIARYTPRDYKPSMQRNFSGVVENPGLRSRPGTARPQTAHMLGSDGLIGAIGRRVSSAKSSIDSRRSNELERKASNEQRRRLSSERAKFLQNTASTRKVSGGSVEQSPAKTKLNIAKRGARVMAAVAALQGKAKDTPTVTSEPVLDPSTIDEAFEAVLNARNVPEPQRQKMRALTLRVKSDFIKQEQGASKTNSTSPPGTLAGESSLQRSSDSTTIIQQVKDNTKAADDEGKASKRSRARSRTFTFSKSDKKNENSPTKKQRSRSKSRPTSIHISKDSFSGLLSPGPLTPTGSLGKTAAVLPADYITYLRDSQDPTKIEVGRLHKLRILLRNETVAWVDTFISMGGMTEIVNLLNRIIVIEWREEHEDQLLHETLLCLKGLCTTKRAMVELDKFADRLFPALLGMLFDDEKKGPAEYSTRTIIINVLFNFLASANAKSQVELEQRAQRILIYLGEPPKSDDARPVEFVLDMQTPRPYRLWSREMSHVTKEVFWIFLHQLNVVPLPKFRSGDKSADGQAQVEEVALSYSLRHFPGSRPPVPAAPYVGGVEWDATMYLAAHLDLLNGLVASLQSPDRRNDLRTELRASGFEKTMGEVLRTCKEKFYSGIHDGLKAWVAAAAEDSWPTRYVREGPTEEEVIEKALRARSASPKKKAEVKRQDAPPKLDAPLRLESTRISLSLDVANEKHDTENDADDDGWLG